MTTTRTQPPPGGQWADLAKGTPAPGRGARPSNLRNRLLRFDMRYMPYAMIAPVFLIFLVFGLFPLIFNAVVAFRHWRLDDPTRAGWAGLENFTKLASDDDFWNALYNTLGIFVMSTIPQLLIALVVASVLNRQLRGQTWWRVGVLLPYVTPITASTMVFNTILARDDGVANWVLGLLGMGSADHPIDWRADKLHSWIAIATMVNWKWIGYNALL